MGGGGYSVQCTQSACQKQWLDGVECFSSDTVTFNSQFAGDGKPLNTLWDHKASLSCACHFQVEDC